MRGCNSEEGLRREEGRWSERDWGNKGLRRLQGCEWKEESSGVDRWGAVCNEEGGV